VFSPLTILFSAIGSAPCRLRMLACLTEQQVGSRSGCVRRLDGVARQPTLLGSSEQPRASPGCGGTSAEADTKWVV